MKQSYTMEEFNSARSVVGDALSALGNKDERVWLLTPDIGFGCKGFQAEHPDRFIDTGIAEQNVVGVSAGLAYEGNIPYIIGMMPFMSMRALEQVRTDVCYPNLPVRIIANYSGLTGNGGSTHYAMEDMALYSSLVNMTVCAASDPVQLRQIIERAWIIRVRCPSALIRARKTVCCIRRIRSLRSVRASWRGTVRILRLSPAAKWWIMRCVCTNWQRTPASACV